MTELIFNGNPKDVPTLRNRNFEEEMKVCLEGPIKRLGLLGDYVTSIVITLVNLGSCSVSFIYCINREYRDKTILVHLNNLRIFNEQEVKVRQAITDALKAEVSALKTTIERAEKAIAEATMQSEVVA